MLASQLDASVRSPSVEFSPLAFRSSPLATRQDSSALHRSISLDLQAVPLSTALDRIGRAAGLRLTYRGATLPAHTRVTLRSRRITAAAALSFVLHGTHLEFVLISPGHVAVVRRATPDHTPRRDRAPPTLLQGVVLEQGTRRPVESATISVPGTALATVTAADGSFVIVDPPPGRLRVRADAIGYGVVEADTVVVEGRSVGVTLALPVDPIQLDRLVAIGYGLRRRGEITGSIASISLERIPLAAAGDLAAVLQGRAPGVLVTHSGGAPGGGISVRIRGTNSISANSEPLYVVDGLPVGQGGNSQDPSRNPLSSIDRANIESIEILKDASSTAIYGARGANGVVLVTTRRGRRGVDEVQLESSIGYQWISKTIPVLTAPEYMRLANEALVNSGRPPKYDPSEIADARTYDYPGMLLRTAPQQSHSIAVSGGDDRSRYLVGGTFLRQDGILLNSRFERFGLRLNLDRDVSRRLRIGNSLSLTRVHQSLPGSENGGVGAGANGILGAMEFDPTAPPRDASGNWTMRSPLSGQPINPIATAEELISQRNQWRAIGSIFAEIELSDQIRMRSSFGGIVANEWNPYFAPRTIAQGNATNGDARVVDTHESQLTSEHLATLRGRVGAADLDVMAGFSVQTSDFRSATAAAQNFPTDATTFNDLDAGATLRPASSDAVEWALLSWIGRASYNLLDRYLVTLTARRDGSSRFGRSNKWAFFPSAAMAWRVTDERFARDWSSLSDLKLRVSYGRTGNQAVEEYQSLGRITNEFYAFGNPSQERVGSTPADALPNPDLKWETQDQYNLGLDLGLLDNRVTLSIDAYRSITKDLLLVVPLATASGYGTQLRNAGSVSNRGVELAVGAVAGGERLGWRGTLSLSANRNEVISLGGLPEILPEVIGRRIFVDGERSHVVRVGEPLGAIYGFRTDGLYQPGDPCELDTPRECAPGEYRVVDVNGDRKIDLNDRTILGYADPEFYGALNSDLRFGALTLNADLHFSFGNEVANLSKIFNEASIGVGNERATVLDRWTPTNTDATIPRANVARTLRLYDRLVEDGSFLRLQALTLAYQLPPGLLPFAGPARVWAMGQNLFVLTKYSGFDPEVNSLGGDSRLRGADLGAYPRSRGWNAGVNVTF